MLMGEDKWKIMDALSNSPQLSAEVLKGLEEAINIINSNQIKSEKIKTLNLVLEMENIR